MRLLVAVCLFSGVLCKNEPPPTRESLLEEARARILGWYPDKKVTEAPNIREGIKVSMLKKDQECGGNNVPVTFAEFDIPAVRPGDVWRTMLETQFQKDWNPQAASVAPIGKWDERGLRAWAVVFELAIVSNREFIQWQAADADFEKQEFWLVFSTRQNEEVRKLYPLAHGAIDSQNCLGAYHITKTPSGVHVVVTQHVNVHPFFPFPLHAILHFLPMAWKGTLDFVHQMSGRAKELSTAGAPLNASIAPAFMLHQSLAEAQRIRKSTKVTFACFALKGVFARLATWIIVKNQTAEEALLWQNQYKGHTSHAIVKIMDGKVAEWFYAWMPITEWHKGAIAAKVLEEFPNIIGSIDAVERKESNLQWASEFGTSPETLEKVITSPRLFESTIAPSFSEEHRVAFSALTVSAVVAGAALAFGSGFYLCRSGEDNNGICNDDDREIESAIE